jgi:hypothetical protein
MIRTIKYILVILAIQAVANYLYLVAIKSLDWDFIKVIEISNQKKSHYDILALGNSLTLDGFNSEVVEKRGYSTYNYGLNGCSYKTQYNVLKEFIRNGNTTHLIILGLSTGRDDLENKESIENIQRMYDYIYSTSINLSDLPLYKFRGSFTQMLRRLVSSSHRETSLYQGHLRVLRNKLDSSQYIPEPSNFDIQTLYNKQHFKYLWMIIELSAENSIPLYLVEYPCSNDDKNSYPIKFNIYHQSSGLKSEILNVNNYVLSDSLFNGQKAWLGNDHLNIHGSIILTNYLMDSIVKRKVLR